jgi:hypothetical protein
MLTLWRLRLAWRWWDWLFGALASRPRLYLRMRRLRHWLSEREYAARWAMIRAGGEWPVRRWF